MNIFDMESSVNSATNSTFRPRKSIFADSKQKFNHDQPRLLLNGQSLESQQISKVYTSPNFHPSSINQHSSYSLNKQNSNNKRKKTGSFCLPDNPLSRVIIGNPSQSQQSQCIRPSSVGKRSVILNPTQLIQIQNQHLNQPYNQKPNQTFIQPTNVQMQMPQPLNSSKISPPYPQQILTASRITPSQTSNFMISSVPATNLKRKSILIQGKPSQKLIYREHSPIRNRPLETISQISIAQHSRQPSRVLIRDDPKTISQLNKLTSLNQFLSQQYNIVNNQLSFFRNKTCQKEVVDDQVFLERSLNKIDDIFLRQTNQALYKLDQISRFASSKGFSKGSASRVNIRKRSPSPTFNKATTNFIEHYTPIKNMESLKNSSYMGVCCNHVDPMQIYQEE